MADKIKDFTSKMGKGGAGMPGAPKGLGIGMKVLAAGMATVYGIKESMYTGKLIEMLLRHSKEFSNEHIEAYGHYQKNKIVHL